MGAANPKKGSIVPTASAVQGQVEIKQKSSTLFVGKNKKIKGEGIALREKQKSSKTSHANSGKKIKRKVKPKTFVDEMDIGEAAQYKEYWYNEYAKKYAEAVNSNKPWKWRQIPGGNKLSEGDKENIRQKAIQMKLVQKAPLKPETQYADFQSIGAILDVQTLPDYLWNAKDKTQFDYLDKLIGGRPPGTTWHHSEISGRMELVPFGIHNISSHVGGRSPGHWAYRPQGR